MHALIDGDILVYKVGFASETHWYDVYIKGEEEHGRLASFDNKTELNFWVSQFFIDQEDTLTVNERIVPDKLENCLHSIKVRLESIVEAVAANRVTIYLTGKDNFRDTLVDYYKESRRDKPKPYYYNEIRDYLVNTWEAAVVDGEEADDAMAIAQWGDYVYWGRKGFDGTSPQECVDSVICTVDKDLLMVPGNHYNFDTQEKLFIDEVDGLRWFYTQLIEGDKTDDIPGIYKITGVRNSKKFILPLASIETEEEMWLYVHNLYFKQFLKWLPKDDPCYEVRVLNSLTDKLIETGRLLWMRRSVEEPLWEPPTQQIQTTGYGTGGNNEAG